MLEQKITQTNFKDDSFYCFLRETTKSTNLQLRRRASQSLRATVAKTSRLDLSLNEVQPKGPDHIT